MHSLCASDLLSGHVAQAEIANVARSNGLGHRANRFFDGRGRIGIVRLPQVDDIDLQALEAESVCVV